MSKFKAGDKVRILDGSKINDYAGDWVDNMKKYIGGIYTIDDIDSDFYGTGGYRMKEIGYVWDERGLELAEKHKFKVGDAVIGNEKANRRYRLTKGGWKGVVVNVYDNYFDAEEFDNGDPIPFPELRYDCFDLVKNNQKIVITHDGKTTTAKLYDGKQVIKTAKAKCNPSDEFDFNVGASIAFARLTDQTENTIEEGFDLGEFSEVLAAIGRLLENDIGRLLEKFK